MSAIEDREEAINFPEDEEIAWREYLIDFRARIWPMFEEQGFTFPQAFASWRQEMIISKLDRILNTLDIP